MPAHSYSRFLDDAGGDMQTAYERLAWAYDDVVRYVSIGHMRAGPKTDRAAKRYVEGLDVPTERLERDSPNG